MYIYYMCFCLPLSNSTARPPRSPLWLSACSYNTQAQSTSGLCVCCSLCQNISSRFLFNSSTFNGQFKSFLKGQHLRLPRPPLYPQGYTCTPALTLFTSLYFLVMVVSSRPYVLVTCYQEVISLEAGTFEFCSLLYPQTCQAQSSVQKIFLKHIIELCCACRKIKPNTY